MGFILYLGTDSSRYQDQKNLIHLPLIETRPIPLSQEILKEFDQFTHLILTSPNAARILRDQVAIGQKQILAIGKGTALQLQGSLVQTATPETQEGLIELLETLPLDNAYLFYPRSSIARPHLANYLREKKLRHQVCDLYETHFLKPAPLPSLQQVEEIIFTSPSTVHAFIALYGALPKSIKLTCIGPITLAALQLLRI